MSATKVRTVLLVLQSTAVGGMETHVIDLAAEFAGRGIAVTVALPPGAAFEPLAARAEVAGAAVWRVTTDARRGRRAQIQAFGALVRRMRTLAPDVVHLHTGGATGGAAVLLAAKLAGVPARVITEHDVPAEHPGRWQRTTRAGLDHLATGVVAVSRRNAGIRQARLPVRARNFAAVLNGVPVPHWDSDARAADRTGVRREFAIPADAVVAGSLVRLAEGKGLDTLLHAFALAEAPDGHLLLVGDGPLRAQLETLAVELGVAARVHFAGEQRSPGRYLAAMDIFALAVPAGSMSIALLEAMARGLPPVITFCGPEEAVIPGETGLGARPDDPEDLAAALSALAADAGLRADLGTAAREHVMRHFSTARVADDLLAVYLARPGELPARLRAAAPPDPRPGGTSVRPVHA